MLYIESEYTNPYINLAMEEYCFNNFDEDVFMLWQNDNTIVVGKYQNTAQEISSLYVKENDIKVARRLSGGGAVYHDLGNLNFTFIKRNQTGDKGFSFKHFTKDIIELLAKLNVNAEFNSRNDLVIDGRKFSGNSQYIKRNRILHHGTLLFDSNIETLTHGLNVSNKKIESKAIASIHERVTNIKPHLSEDISVDQFKDFIKEYFMGVYELIPLSFTEDQMNQIRNIAKQKYEKWDWNFGESPPSTIKKSDKCDGGLVEVYLDIKDGLVYNIKLYGDFFALDTLEESLNKIKGKPYDAAVLKNNIYEVADSINDIEREWLYKLVME